MLNALIIDDEQSARDALSILLTTYCPDITLLGTADSVTAGVQKVFQITTDILLECPQVHP